MNEVEAIIRKHGPLVWRIVCRLVGGMGREADAADCFQEVFVAAMEVGRREKVVNWEGMLRRIATVKGLDALRARIRRRSREQAGAEWELIAAGGEGPDARMRRGEMAESLRGALAEIEPREAEMFCLKYVEGMSYEEIGGLMGMTGNAVGVVLHRTREALRRVLARDTKVMPGEVPYE